MVTVGKKDKILGIIHLVMGCVIIAYSIYAICTANNLERAITQGEYIVFLYIQPLLVIVGYDKIMLGIDQVRADPLPVSGK